jgi:hypothetical protein
MCTLFVCVLFATAKDARATDAAKHLGVASCASLVCHGALVPLQGSRVAQNEYTVWLQKDRHAKAYQTLLSERSKQIAAALDIGPPHTEVLCLNCHAANTPNEQRGERFQITDGVSCEVCHGAAERWIATHTNEDASHADNVARGMLPTDDPRKRGELCLSCHLGTGDQFVTHRVMAAGHPRLSFELDTFTHLQPPHFRLDADYAERKQAPSSAELWMVGQATAAAAFVALARDVSSQHGRWPEFALFDCYSCHRPIRAIQRARPSDLPLGLPRPNRSSFLFVRELLARVSRTMLRQFDEDVLLLNRTLSGPQPSTSAGLSEMHRRWRANAERVAAWNPTVNDLRDLLASLTSDSLSARWETYADAEQLTMAVQALVATLSKEAGLDAQSTKRIDDGMQGLFEATQDDIGFNMESFRAAVRRLRPALTSLQNLRLHGRGRATRRTKDDRPQ